MTINSKGYKAFFLSKLHLPLLFLFSTYCLLNFYGRFFKKENREVLGITNIWLCSLTLWQ